MITARADWRQRIPGYVLVLRDIAKRAGLVTTFAHDSENAAVLSTWKGTEAQFRATGLSNHRFPSFPGREALVQLAYVGSGTMKNQGDGIFSFDVSSLLPEKVDHHADTGILVYTLVSGEQWFYGERVDMLAAGLLRESQIPPQRGSDGRRLTRRSSPFGSYCKRPKWTVELRVDGKLSYWLESEASRTARVAKRDTEMRDYARRYRAAEPQALQDSPPQNTPKLWKIKSATDLLKALATAVYDGAFSTFLSAVEVRTEPGCLYRMTPEARERFKQLMDDLYHDLLDLPISTTRVDMRPDPERKIAAQRVAKAETDPAFKQFMRELLPQASSGGAP